MTTKNTSFARYFLLLLALFMVGSVATVHPQGLYVRKSDAGNCGDQNCDSIVKTAMTILYSNPDSARNIVTLALGYSQGKLSKGVARLQNVLGATYHVQAEYGQALDHYFNALSVAKAVGDSVYLANIFNNIGTVNLKTGNYREALEYFHQAVNEYENRGKKAEAASTFNNMGLLFHEINNANKAKTYFNLALNGFQTLNDSIGISASLNNLGMVYAKTTRTDSAIYYYDRAAQMSQDNNNLYGLCISWQGRANLYSALNFNQQAGEAYLLSCELARKIKQPYQEAFAMLGLASVLMKEGQTKAALDTAQQAMTIAHQINNQVLQYQAHETLSRIYETRGELLKSLENYRQYAEIKDDLLNQAILHQVYNMELNSLHQANVRQQLEIESQKMSISKMSNQLIFSIIIFSLAVAGLYLLYLYFRYRQKERLQQTIISLNEKKSRAAIEAEIGERQRIGRELHDGIGQMLSVARLHISAIQQKKQLPENRRDELLIAAIHSVDEAFDELRNISHNLAPSLLSEKGLIEALKNLTALINQSNQLKMSVESFGMNGSIDPLIEHTLYRAIQELLNNAIKHGGASHFSVQLIKGEAEITLMVEDNGQGFEVSGKETLSQGGLGNIRSRVENLNGTMFIDSLPSRGTIITIVIPLKKNP